MYVVVVHEEKLDRFQGRINALIAAAEETGDKLIDIKPVNNNQYPHYGYIVILIFQRNL